MRETQHRSGDDREAEFPFDSMAEVIAEIERIAGEIVRRGKVPVVLGGEHSISGPVAAATAGVGRNRTLHCGMTGPLFILGAVAAALIEAATWQFDMAVVWGVVLLGVGIARFVEWRTAGQHGQSNACAP